MSKTRNNQHGDFPSDLANCLADVDAVAFARTRLGFQLDSRQTTVLGSLQQFVILNCRRQWGKSTVCAIKALHRLETHPGCLVLVITPSDRQSRVFVRKTSHFVRELGYPVRGDGDNPVSLQLPNLSRMVVAVGNGDIWLMSTPKGRRGFFYNTWSGTDPEWTRIAVPATECPRISAKFLRQEEQVHGSRSFRQEYMCESVGDNELLFNEELIRSLATVSAWTQPPPQPGKRLDW